MILLKNKLKIRILTFKILSLIWCSLLFNQISVGQTAFGAHPIGMNWQEIKSPSGNIVFPKGMESQANRVANIINFQHDNLTRSVGSKYRHVNILLTNQGVIPNGFVGPAPFRSEFYTVPPSNTDIFGSINWLDLLAIHEYRHVLQYSNALHGVSKVGSYLMGDFGWGLFYGFSVPNWYAEGDAVIIETANTLGGRGRTPTFTNQLRALMDADIRFKYLKFRNGSLKDLVPNQYPIGYTMLTYVREHKGNDIIATVLKDGSSYRSIIYPFSRAMKKHSGYTTTELYKASLDELQQEQQEKLADLPLTNTTPVTSKNYKTPTNYTFSQYTEKGEILVWKQSFKELGKIVQNPGIDEKKIVHPGISNPLNYFNYSSNKLVWTNRYQRPKRTYVQYSDISLYDMASKKKTRITKKGKYFSPSLAPDGRQIVTVVYGEFHNQSLRLIDVLTKEETEIYSLPERDVIVRPSFTPDGNSIVFIEKNGNKGVSLKKVNITTRNVTALTPRSRHSLSAPRVRGDYVYYGASFSGIDNIYRSPLDGSKKIEQLTSVRIGAYSPDVSPDGNTLLMTEHTHRGLVISKINFSDLLMKEISIVEPIDMKWQGTGVAAKNEGGNILDKKFDTKYTSGKYNRFFRGLKLHTWGISGISTSDASGTLTLGNYLTDILLKVKVGYNINEGNPIFSSTLKFGKWYPNISITGSIANRNSDFLNENNTKLSEQSYLETSGGIDVEIPLAWTSGNTNTNLSISSGVTHYSTSNRELKTATGSVNAAPISSFQALNSSISFSAQRVTARQHLAPRLGIATSINYQKDITSSDNDKYTANIRLSFPGLFRNHSFRVTGDYQNEPLKNEYQYIDTFLYPKGFKSLENDEFWKIGFNYSLPLAYPDFGLFGIFFIKRFTTNLFYEHGKGTTTITEKTTTTTLQSTGIELLADTQLFNLLNVNLGYGLSYLLTEDPNNKGKNYIGRFIFKINL